MLTINVPNLPAPPATKFDLTSTGFSFAAKVGDASKNIESKEYSFKLDFFEEIDVENSKQHLTSKSLYCVLRKKQAKEEFWPRLTKDKVRLHNVKTDFDKWVDEDEQNDAEAEDLSGMGGMGGMPGMGGMDPAMMGMGGAGGLDLQQMMAQMGGAGGMGMPDFGAGDDDDDDDDVADDDVADDAAAAAAAAPPAADESK
ncbi:HSP20-like chaperone [Testicularia cyperi]|uniref:HSP20-like chaperone n=1 Tax=Testicularia cyperi TaxID=1882483 RepID=A0A317XFY3_9BASI|nr:HSP20-like chaperone [Testicularia cyperi]